MRASSLETNKELQVPVWAWWLLVFVGITARLIFLFRGNIAFNGDEASRCMYVKAWVSGSLDDFTGNNDLAGLRLWISALFYRLTGGWVYFGSLNAIFLTSLSFVIWIRWVYGKVSPVAAFAMACVLAVPPASVAYYCLLQERRMETHLWASLIVVFSGQWLRSYRWALLFGLIIGWVYSCEPFFVFFAGPVLVFELWKNRNRTKKFLLGVFMSLSLGSVAGLVLGHFENSPYSDLGSYVHWGFKNWRGIHENLTLLINAFPQFWNGNMPLGYLQNSKLGLSMIPVGGTGISEFFEYWTFFVFVLTVLGFFWPIFQKKSWAWELWIMGLIPAFFYFLFFVFSSQIWDALCFRYLGFWIVFVAMGFGLFTHQMFVKNHKAGILFAVFWIGLQGFAMVWKYQRLPDRNPALAIAEGFEKIGITEGYANHWAAEPARYLSGDRVLLSDYVGFDSGRVAKSIQASPRIGVAVLEGLDDPGIVEKVVSYLGRTGYHADRVWPMLNQWSIIEFKKTIDSSTVYPQSPVNGRAGIAEIK